MLYWFNSEMVNYVKYNINNNRGKVMQVTKGIKIKIYPNKDQKAMLNQWFGNAFFLWNLTLDMINTRYKNNSNMSFIWKYTLNNLLPLLKDEYSFLKISEASSLQAVNESLHLAFKEFFKKNKSYPKFKSKKRCKSSVTIKNNKNIDLVYNAIKVPKLGYIKARWSSNVSYDKIKRITIYKTSSNKYYISVTVISESQALVNTDKSIGLDVGQKELLIGSDGLRIQSLNIFNLERKLNSWKRKLSRRYRLAKSKGLSLLECKNYQKAKVMVAKLYEKISNIRKDYIHKVSKFLIEKYDFLVLEDIKINNLFSSPHDTSRLKKANNHKLANQSWYMLRIFLEYKANWYGKKLVLVNPSYTSRDCSVCGYRFNELTLNDGEWTCPSCHTHHDRDINAAKNILKLGTSFGK